MSRAQFWFGEKLYRMVYYVTVVQAVTVLYSLQLLRSLGVLDLTVGFCKWENQRYMGQGVES